jgi:hypothetical protein
MVLYTFYEELKMLSEEQLLRKQYRHAIKFIVRCDLTLDTDRTGSRLARDHIVSA